MPRHFWVTDRQTRAAARHKRLPPRHRRLNAIFTYFSLPGPARAAGGFGGGGGLALEEEEGALEEEGVEEMQKGYISFLGALEEEEEGVLWKRRGFRGGRRALE